MTRSRTFPFRPAGFFVLRAPLLPFDELLRWGEGVQTPGALGDREQLEAALARDRACLRERLRAVASRPEVREAVFVASPDLDAKLDTWLRDPRGAKAERVEAALVRYVERMAGRATPFGLFAGGAVGTIGERTHLAVSPRTERRRHTRLDMNYLSALTAALAADPGFRQTLHHRPNSSLYRAAGRLRYVEARLKNGTRSHHLVAVDGSPYLDVALERARSGARPEEVAAAIVAFDAEIAFEEAAAYVEELIDSQLLVPELEPPVTGEEALDGVLSRLREHPAASDVVARLEEVRGAMRSLDVQPPAADSATRYRRVAEQLAALPAAVELPRLFQVDMTRPAGEATLGGEPLTEILRGVELLHRIAPAGEDPLAAFRSAFVARYEAREVPLVEVLDEEIGIGFDASGAPEAEGAPLLQGIAFPLAAQGGPRWSARDAALLRLVEDAARSGADVVELGEALVAALQAAVPPPPLPDAFLARAAVAAVSQEALEAGDFRVVVEWAGGPSGARLMGRFCHADPELHRRVEEHLRAEETLRPRAVFAEVVHLPEGRIGNILFRPVLRGYEIPYLGGSGAPADRQLPVTDLWVSVVGERVVLRSAQLGCEVLPRLTSAHNFGRRSVGTYRFLCSLQAQGVAGGVRWSWGALESAAFLPRVTSGRLVLARARWRLDEGELMRLTARGVDPFPVMQELRVRRNLPRWVMLADGDNELAVDLDNVLSVDAFVRTLRGRADARLVELFPPPDALAAHGPEGRYVHELAVPLERVPAPGEPRPVATGHPAGVTRTFAPGSEWLYLKLYTGTATADRLLREVVGPLVRGATESGAADRWFFIRYGDPEWHLRVRLHGTPERLLAEVIPALRGLTAPLLAEGSLWRVQLDTYEREVERYGGAEGVDLAERLFHADSEAVLVALEDLQGDEKADLRWRVGLCGTDALLADLGLDPVGRREVVRRMEASLAKEHGMEVALKRELSGRFRRERAPLEEMLRALHGGDALSLPLAALRRRSEMLRPIAEDLCQRERSGRLTLPVAVLAGSYTHMHLNRHFRSAARAQEMVIYHLLGRLYEAEMARFRGS